MINCTELTLYVKQNCGGCYYNWTLHKQYITHCINGTLECVTWCGIERMIIPHWLQFAGFIAFLFLILWLRIKQPLIPK